MADRNQVELEGMLDAALAKYAAIEPRAGLEDRVLANLRAEQARVPNRAWWRWSVAGALAVVIIGLGLAWRSGKPSQPFAANHPSPPAESPAEVPTSRASKFAGNANGGTRATSKNVATQLAGHRRHAVAGSNPPKLDQFPSPQPLSEQEKRLQSYVAKYPEHAVLVARALTNALSPDQLKGMQAFPIHTGAMASEEPNDDTTER